MTGTLLCVAQLDDFGTVVTDMTATLLCLRLPVNSGCGADVTYIYLTFRCDSHLPTLLCHGPPVGDDPGTDVSVSVNDCWM